MGGRQYLISESSAVPRLRTTNGRAGAAPATPPGPPGGRQAAPPGTAGPQFSADGSAPSRWAQLGKLAGPPTLLKQFSSSPMSETKETGASKMVLMSLHPRGGQDATAAARPECQLQGGGVGAEGAQACVRGQQGAAGGAVPPSRPQPLTP